MTHGLQPGFVALGMQFGLDGELDSILKVWLLRGYNVGVFLWTQFADEKITNFVHTEDQIYTTGGFVKMRYRVQKNVTKRGSRFRGNYNETYIKILEAPQDKTVFGAPTLPRFRVNSLDSLEGFRTAMTPRELVQCA